MVLDGASMAIVFVGDPEQDGALSQSVCAAPYGMTANEAAVAGLISKGTGVQPLPEI